jgi:phosphoribosylanthranilate isomerase
MESEKLRNALKDTTYIQVIHVESSFDDALGLVRAYEPFAHAFLLDSGSPTKGVLGGTGQKHDWDISAKLVRSTALPVYLAGGLNARNVGEAIRRVKPHGVDLCSSVRSNGKLDCDKLMEFIDAVRLANEINSSKL